MDEEFDLDGFTYKQTKMDARVQLHVCRRVTPLMSIVPAMLTSKGDLLSRAAPFAEALAHMQDEEVDYILDKCLAVLLRKQAGDTGWAKVWSPQAQKVMFDDIELPTMLKLTARVIIDRIVPFFPALALTLNGVAGAGNSKP